MRRSECTDTATPRTVSKGPQSTDARPPTVSGHAGDAPPRSAARESRRTQSPPIRVQKNRALVFAVQRQQKEAGGVRHQKCFRKKARQRRRVLACERACNCRDNKSTQSHLPPRQPPAGNPGACTPTPGPCREGSAAERTPERASARQTDVNINRTKSRSGKSWRFAEYHRKSHPRRGAGCSGASSEGGQRREDRPAVFPRKVGG
jgi:hypothetical protein